MHILKKGDTLQYLLYNIFFISLTFSFRAITTISIILILITTFVKNRSDNASWINHHANLKFLLACMLFYGIQLMSLLHTHNISETVKYIRIQSTLIILPLALGGNNFIHAPSYQRLMRSFIYILCAAMFYCFLLAFYKFFFLHRLNAAFFYHELVSPLNQNAIVVSILLFTAFIHLAEKTRKMIIPAIGTLDLLLICFLLICIILLSSKLIIIFLCVYLVYFSIVMFKRYGKSNKIIIGLLVVSLVMVSLLFTQNPVGNRFREMISGKFNLNRQEHFSPDVYFNGLQFRALQWRFVTEILNEKKAWLIGVSTGDGQALLDEKYISTNMYTGDGSSDSGYKGYDTHNQFLEALLQSGIPGLLSVLYICYWMIRLAINRRRLELTVIVLLLCAYAFVESCFQSQYEILIFIFLPLFIYYGTEDKKDEVKKTINP